MARRAALILLLLLGSALLITTLILSSISLFLGIDEAAYISEEDVPWPDPRGIYNVTIVPFINEQVPRILHQTWKDEVIPEKWRGVSESCRDLMADYEYVLWTDASSRQFIAEHYSWFLATFDGYEYPIQRADAIRYFVLYHYGGAYLDLDVGCLRRLDPLLSFSAVLPRTKPVGLSNDVMLAAPGHPLMRRAIESLQSFDHDWIMNYPTVMFSTGPMFISTIYALHTSSPEYPRTWTDEVRVLPKPLYGKNAAPGEAPHSFFTHYYGSSWHADDAGFVGFLGTYGTFVMWVAGMVFFSCTARFSFLKLRAAGWLPYHIPSSKGWHRLGRNELGLRTQLDSRTRRHRVTVPGIIFTPSSSSSSAPSTPLFSPSSTHNLLPLTIDDETESATDPTKWHF